MLSSLVCFVCKPLEIGPYFVGQFENHSNIIEAGSNSVPLGCFRLKTVSLEETGGELACCESNRFRR